MGAERRRVSGRRGAFPVGSGRDVGQLVRCPGEPSASLVTPAPGPLEGTAMGLRGRVGGCGLLCGARQDTPLFCPSLGLGTPGKAARLAGRSLGPHPAIPPTKPNNLVFSSPPPKKKTSFGD